MVFKRTANLFECPFCLEMQCKVDASDFDDANQKSRTRICPNCGPFSTIEVPVLTGDGKPVPMMQFATNKRQQVRDAQRIRKGYRAIGARYRSGTVHVMVRYQPPTKDPFNVCWRGHEFTEENTYVAPNGRRSCRTCKKGHQKEYKTVNADKIREQQRVRLRLRRAARKAAETAAMATAGG